MAETAVAEFVDVCKDYPSGLFGRRKGFALTLAIGVVVSMFSAITVTRTFLNVASAIRPLRKLWLWTDDTPEDAIPARARATDLPAEAVDA